MWNTWPEAQDLGDLARGTGVATTSFELASRLTDRAIAAGGRDNITVVVVDVDPTRTGPEEAP
jgi:serine/threonine protein phosphatase PrpC